MPQPSDIVLFTSVVPGDMTRQRAALESWSAAGFTLVSLNDPPEHAALAEAAADLPVTFRPVARSLRERLGRPLILIDDILAQGRADPRGFIGIVNSDIALRRPETLIGLLRDQPFDMMYGSRLDIDNAADADGHVYDGGYDFFLFSQSVAASIPSSDFAIGRTFYDYFLPFCALIQGFRTVECRRPLIDHVRHPVRYDPSELLNTSVMMANVVLDLMRAATIALPPGGEPGRADPRRAVETSLGIYGAFVSAYLDEVREPGDDGGDMTAASMLFKVTKTGVSHFLRQGAAVVI